MEVGSRGGVSLMPGEKMVKLPCDAPVDRFLRAREKVASSEPMPGCICNEPKQKMKCQHCGFETICTIRRRCDVHPRTVLLMALDVCPHCRRAAEDSFVPVK